MLTQAKLAEFHNTSDRSVRRWSAEEKHRKTVQLEADVTPLEWQLVGEIAQLCYLYNAQNWHCETPQSYVLMSMNSFEITVGLYREGIPSSIKSITVKLIGSQFKVDLDLLSLKKELEKVVY